MEDIGMGLSKKHERFLSVETDKNGNKIFSFNFAAGLETDLVEVYRLPPAETAKARKLYKQTYQKKKGGAKEVPTHPLMGFLAHQNNLAHKEGRKGLLDDVLSEDDIQKARQNIIPQGFEIHHLQPISLGGKNSFDNLLLLSQGVHKAIHRCMDCVLAYVPYRTTMDFELPDGQKVFIRLPKLQKCLTDECGLFPTDLMRDNATKAISEKPLKEESPEWDMWRYTIRRTGSSNE